MNCLQDRIYFRSILTTCCFVLLHFSFANRCAAESAQSMQDIIRAWQNHTQSISSFMYECDLKETNALYLKSGLPTTFNNRSVGKAIGGRDLSRKIRLKAQGKKLFRQKQGEAWDPGKNLASEHEWVFVYDGKEMRKLVRNNLHAFGLGTIGDTNSNLKRYLYARDSSPIMIWHDPAAFMKHTKLSPEDYSLSESTFLVGDEECIKIEHGSNKSGISFLVLNELPYLPKMLSMNQQDGTTVMTTEITYGEHTDGSKYITSWVSKSYSATKELQSKIDVTVTAYAKNLNYKDSDFEYSFPIGSHILQLNDSDQKFWIQSTEGKMTPIDQDDYGKSDLPVNKATPTKTG